MVSKLPTGKLQLSNQQHNYATFQCLETFRFFGNSFYSDSYKHNHRSRILYERGAYCFQYH